jgi:ankyrin repeat protein
VRRALKIFGIIVGILLVIVLGPWLIVAALWVAGDIAQDIALRRYKPTSLPDAVAYKYATPDLVARFIDRGADVNQRIPGVNGAPAVPLIADACSRANVDVARLLLHRGAHIQEANIWSVARNGHEQMARMLVEEGASLGRQPYFEEAIGPELIQAAAFGGQAWLVQLISQKGADVQVVNAAGEGLLALALWSEYHDSLETTKALLAAKAHVNPLTDAETPPLYWAAYRGKVEEVDLLLAAGARVDAPVARGVMQGLALPPEIRVTPLSVAVENCHYDVAERLLQHGASKKSAVIYDGKSLTEGACYHILDSDKAQRDEMRALLAR